MMSSKSPVAHPIVEWTNLRPGPAETVSQQCLNQRKTLMMQTKLTRVSYFVTLSLFTLVTTSVMSEEPSLGVTSNNAITAGKVGDEVPSFYVRAVTGPLAGKSVCYVCRHGDRPVVMVLVRELGTHTTSLLKELDQCVNQHRADGLRCFAVLVTGTPQREAPRLQTLAFDEKLELPLTLTGEAVAAATALNIAPDAALTAILYEDRHIVSRFSFRSGACDAEARQTIVSSAKLLAGQDRTP